MDVLDVGEGYESLSVKDLLDARDLYHNHLLGKRNVVGTAIGLYLIRDEDHAAPGPDAGDHAAAAGPHRATERRLDNARVRPYSWPCVLAFVTQWLAPDEFGGDGGLPPDAAVPTRLYMPDGRVVPVCVVKVTPAEPSAAPLIIPNWPDAVAGGGYPLLVEVQGEERVASVGCLVSDGHTTYALTNRHVCGAEGEPVYTRMRGKRVRIGQASAKQLTRRPFSEVYPDYPGRRTYAALDAGLVELDDLSGWTSQIYGLGSPGELADLSERTISLRLIGAPVSAFGAASGRMDGRIAALFYRYKSVGGFDWVADFLIAPRMDSEPDAQPGRGPQTRHGDSGTVWHLPPAPDDPQRRPRPLALEWGGQTLLASGGRATNNFALATGLSGICKLLDVEVAGAHNLGYRLFWGSEGHYTIAALACGEARDPALKALMAANQGRIAFDVAAKNPDEIQSQLKLAQSGVFIPLADVPDIVWKQSPRSVPGGRDTQFNALSHRWTGPEHPTHYADIDQTRPQDNKSLRELSLENPANMSVPFWQAFYDAAGAKESRSRGLLPFRVWQFFDAMTDAVRAKDAARFVCAAGILSHYVGDACQPLHGSVYSDGDPNDQTRRTVHHRDGTTEEVSVKRGQGVHSTYEDAMVDDHAADLLAGIPQALKAVAPLPPVASGQAAAVAVVALMDRAAQRIPPKALVDAYVQAGGGKGRGVRDALWDGFGQQTIATMADGAQVLAALWDGAWREGGGIAGAGDVGEDALKRLYADPAFVPSLDLDHIGPALQAGTPTAPAQPAARAPTPRRRTRGAAAA